ncbi:hypothetical protein [Nocardioides sp.]|uniref:hypothetical protein n=1 Tax=Nocardioides sp. TaxID=35761 RepID=UPI002621819A|nr:hypothetical protein [Nocardioides sp.]
MAGPRRCTAHPHVVAATSSTSSGAVTPTACGPWCVEFLAELDHVSVSTTGSWLDAEPS